MSLTHSSPTCGAVLFRLLMVVSLWDGPVVWGHSHIPGDPGLARHVARFHSQPSEAIPLGWHWHCSYPDWDSSDDRQDGGPSHRSRLSTVIPPAEGRGFAHEGGGHVAAVQEWGTAAPAAPGELPNRIDRLAAARGCLPLRFLCRMTC